jgi:hypothetical protein
MKYEPPCRFVMLECLLCMTIDWGSCIRESIQCKPVYSGNLKTKIRTIGSDMYGRDETQPTRWNLTRTRPRSSFHVCAKPLLNPPSLKLTPGTIGRFQMRDWLVKPTNEWRQEAGDGELHPDSHGGRSTLSPSTSFLDDGEFRFTSKPVTSSSLAFMMTADREGRCRSGSLSLETIH